MKYKRGEKGQITLFVVLAIVIVSVIVLLLVIKPEIFKPKMSEEEAKRFLAPKIEELRDFTAECVEKTSSNYFERIGAHAGYYKYSGLSTINFAGEKVIVAYKGDGEFVNALPSLSLICGEGFNVYMQKEGYAMLDSCTDNFESFKKVMEVNTGAREITAECREEDVVIKVDWSIKASKADVSLDVKPKDVKLLIPLSDVLSVANDIVNEEVRGNHFEFGTLSGYVIGKSEKLSRINLNMQHYPGDEQMIYYLTTEPYRKGEKEYNFYFAVNRA